MKNLTNIEWLKEFETYLTRRFPNRSTTKHYISDLEIFMKSTDKALMEVREEEINKFVNGQLSKKLKPSTVKRRVAALKTFFDFLISQEKEIDIENPVSMRRYQIKLPKLLPRDLPNKELEVYLKAVKSSRDRALVSVMAYAGLRVGEAAGLKKSDIIIPDEETAPIKLRVLGKGQKERIVYLLRDGYKPLEQYLQDNPPVDNKEPIFRNRLGKPIGIGGIQERFRHYSKLSGVEVTPHKLRHTFARWMAEGEVPLLILSRLLGHDSLQSTQRYTDGANPRIEEHYEKAMERASEYKQSVSFPEVQSSEKPTVIRSYPASFDGSNWMPAFPQWLREGCFEWIEHWWFIWKPSQRKHHSRVSLGILKLFWQWQLEHKTFSSWDDLTKEDIEKYINAQLSKKLKAKTIKNRVDRIFGLLYYLEERGKINKVPKRVYIDLPRCLPRHISPQEFTILESYMTQLQEKAEIEDWLLIALYYLLQHGGLRISEALDLKVKDIDLSSRRIRVIEGKEQKDRIVYLTERAADAVSSYLKTVPHLPEDILLSWRGRPIRYDFARKLIHELGESLGINELSAQRLRHTFATLLINHGMSIEGVQRLMGHENINTTLIYADLADPAIEADYKKIMSNVFSKLDKSLCN